MESHTFDDIDLKLLHALEIDARAPFSRIAAVLGVSDQTVARRFRKLRSEAGLRVVAVRCATARSGLEHWMLRLRCTPDGASAIAEALARRPGTAWVGLTSGGTEVACTIRSRTRGESDELLLGKLPRTPHIVEIRAHQLLHRFYGPAGWVAKSGALTAAQAAALAPEPHPRPGDARITEEDEPLVAVLEQDGRATYPELQKASGRSESAVKRRLAQLIGSRAIYLDVEFDSGRFGFHNAAMLSITAAPRSLDAVGEAVAAHPEIVYAAATTGPSNLMAVAVTRDTAHLYSYLSGGIGVLDGVEHVETMPFLRRLKQLTYQPFRG
ncbi:AsnC family transcriptional regulator [Streptomyces sp. MST-110588]|uniref:Lrp/AsnC family transcriptional regulator n=1 Tax=Streptomyces sp. MST-110588 TaxID=2833628 RepID=UPI001F5CFAFE|nr:AsnC family transcriptional regulator [Streptomyces sp. MST-110588]UNO38503.1 AsnC family transcriptional regulator [Streptomyces sp. MST-110588]